MSGARILLAALALLLLAALWLLGSRAAREPARAAPADEPIQQGAAPAQLLSEPPVSAAGAPRRTEEPFTSAGGGSEPSTGGSTRTVEILVTDTAKSPLAGVRLHFTRGYEGETVADVTTDAGGRARIERPSNPSCFLAVEHEGFVPFRDYCELGESRTLELIRAVRIAGRVLDAATRAPLAGAQISCHHEACRFCEPEAVVSDAEGRYELEHVPAATELEAPRLVVRISGYPSHVTRLDTSAAPERLEHDLLLERGLTVSGRVLAFPGCTPLEGAYVRVDGQSFATDALGHFQGPVSEAPGQLRLMAGAKEHCTMLVEIARDRMDAPLEILLPRACALEGSVRDPQGRPLSGARVSVVAALDEQARRNGADATGMGLPEGHRFVQLEESLHVETDAEGRYRLDGLLPMEQVLHASAEGFRPLRAELDASFTLGSTGRRDVVLDPLGCTGSIRGRVTLNDAPAKLTIHWKGGTREGYVWAQGERYELVDVECGAVRVDVRLGGGGQRLFPEDLQVTAGGVLEHDLDLRRPMGRITGHVRYENGQPAAGFAVQTLHPSLNLEELTESDAEGAYAFEVPENARPYMLLVRFAGDSQVLRDVRPGGPPIDFVVPELAPLRYRTPDAESGEEIAQSLLLWRRPGEATFRLVGHFLPPDAQGWRTVTVPRGPLELLVRADAQGYRAMLVTGVEAGDPDGETFPLERGTSTRFTLDEGVEPFPDDHVLLLVEAEAVAGLRVDPRECERVIDPSGLHPLGLEHRRLRFGADRVASLAGLSPGVHRFRVCPEDLSIEPAEVTVEAETREPIPIRWSRR